MPIDLHPRPGATRTGYKRFDPSGDQTIPLPPASDFNSVLVTANGVQGPASLSVVFTDTDNNAIGGDWETDVDGTLSGYTPIMLCPFTIDGGTVSDFAFRLTYSATGPTCAFESLGVCTISGDVTMTVTRGIISSRPAFAVLPAFAFTAGQASVWLEAPFPIRQV